MRHTVLENWSRGQSGLHRRDPRAKLLVLAIFLVTLSTAERGLPVLAPLFLAILLGGVVWARIPPGSVLIRAGVVFFFTIPFALVSFLAGDAGRAGALLCKSYLSALAVLLTVSTTPVPMLLRGMETAGAPRFLLTVAQFLYRYLFVIAEEAEHMREAAVSRGATRAGILARRERFQAAAGALGALFGRSYGRAEDIHRAMLARGFDGRFATLDELHFRGPDAVFAGAASLAVVLARVAGERFARWGA